MVAWRQFVKWWRTLFLSLKRQEKINWQQKINELIEIINKLLDISGYTKKPSPPKKDKYKLW